MVSHYLQLSFATYSTVPHGVAQTARLLTRHLRCVCCLYQSCRDICALITHHWWRSQTVITTHFREVFDLDLLRLPHATLSALEAPAGAAVATPPSIKFYQMDVVVDKQTSGVGGTADDPEYLDIVTPLFRLVPGRAAKSYGLACARMAGMPEGVLARAAAVTSALESGSPVPLPALSGPAAVNFRRMFAAMESQAFCADAIMSVKDWCTADPAQLRVLLQYFVASAT